MKYAFHPAAKIELAEAIHYYETCRTRLGSEFAKEVYSTVKRITEFPEAWMLLTKNTRRCLTKRFPYALIYHIGDGRILIVAVMQLNRKPDYWKNRIP
uniref:ParE toxin of type II toxin-antitoxin system, parDE n=1 Tax=Candidatus Kentrum eta TaxID=2126337 RepID=A0A450VEY8_9GAMM|nr:MAG: ParE toxin of type II toxin-antitoxin system, parDE [Candidatus Kentron sp. H]VFK00147.1 MAG: ParE toxin of type II toxin-antitoxin system, parDE [Candidatus Kentron sp. H]VFK03366.1 MAG: ParE toxin of type II toxin-antitoxin system, parDE [Candidatus Kentron sp. H]